SALLLRCSRDLSALPSFPTRRSSDLKRVSAPLEVIVDEQGPATERLRHWLDLLIAIKRRKVFDDPELFTTYMELAAEAREVVKRSEEHTSELQSRENLVCRLLLEKKK